MNRGLGRHRGKEEDKRTFQAENDNISKGVGAEEDIIAKVTSELVLKNGPPSFKAALR